MTDSTDWHGVAVNPKLLCLDFLTDLRVHGNEPFEDRAMDCTEHQLPSCFDTLDDHHQSQNDQLVPYTMDEGYNIAEMLAVEVVLAFP